MKPKPDSPVKMIDPSLLLRPEEVYEGKPIDAFRDYTVNDSDPVKERVRRTYYEMHTNMTVDFVRAKMAKWLKFNTFKATIKEALIKLNELVDESDPDTDLPNIVHAFQTAERIRKDHPDDDWFQLIGLIHDLGKATIEKALIKLNELVDESDPDTDLPNIVHAFQTAERIRKDHPDDDWFQLIGLIHDLGKVMAFYNEPQWCVVGDTFALGCKWGKSIVYGDDSFKENPDTYNPLYNTECGMYEPHCGLENLLMSWGHDEYLYRFLVHNKAKFPKQGLWMIRYHSFYPWHAGGDYKHLLKPGDEEIMKTVTKFNQYDLYTKSAEIPDIEALWPYYEKLIEKYIPGVCEW